MTKKAIVWVREDFRVENNEALAYASQNHEFVSAIYIYNSKNFDKNIKTQNCFIWLWPNRLRCSRASTVSTFYYTNRDKK